MSEVDTMRWGDTQSLLLTKAEAAGEGGVATSSQMLNAVWQRPCVWRLMVTIDPSIEPGDAAVTFDIAILLFVGIGQANQKVPLAVQHFATPFNPVTLFFDIPAEAMQLQFAVQSLSNAITDPNSLVKVSAFAAPHSEPAGIVQIRDHMNRDVRSPDRDGLPRWMPAGFDDGEVRYR